MPLLGHLIILGAHESKDYGCHCLGIFNIQLGLSRHLALANVLSFCFSQSPAIPGGSRGINGGQMDKVQDPEELAKELSASLTRYVPGSWVLNRGIFGLGGDDSAYVKACGGTMYGSARLGVHLCTDVFLWKNCEQVCR